ncbi:MAG: bifunctional folylpolyglutamate synthase/dihydrofolate synthase, partial [Dehalococcoidia bacterium]
MTLRPAWTTSPAMDYRHALDYLLSFADYERASASPIRYRDFNLERVRQLLSRVGNPEASFASVHIAGTKGKGSTAAMVASVLKEAGCRTGLYTSPHLHTMRERIAIDGSPISEQEFAEGVDALQPAVAEVNAGCRWGRLTTFELLTALGFFCFAGRSVQLAVVEVGMGGRLDATNVLRPRVTAITSISLD